MARWLSLGSLSTGPGLRALNLSPLTAVSLVCLAAPAMLAADYDVALRGVGDTFTRTSHAQLSMEGPAAAMGQSCTQRLEGID
jgi:hypothetical protein